MVQYSPPTKWVWTLIEQSDWTVWTYTCRYNSSLSPFHDILIKCRDILKNSFRILLTEINTTIIHDKIEHKLLNIYINIFTWKQTKITDWNIKCLPCRAESSFHKGVETKRANLWPACSCASEIVIWSHQTLPLIHCHTPCHPSV